MLVSTEFLIDFATSFYPAYSLTALETAVLIPNCTNPTTADPISMDCNPDLSDVQLILSERRHKP